MHFQYREAIQTFVTEITMPNMRARTALSDLYHVYEAWCDQLNMPWVSISVFGREISKYYPSAKSRGKTRYMVSIKPGIVVEENNVQETPPASNAG